MGEGLMKRNQSLHCQYHQERGHATKDCKTLWNHLEQLVRDGRLKQFLYRPNGQGDHGSSGTQGKASSRPLLGTINVIFTALGRTGSCPSRDKVGIIQPHDDALVVTLRIEGYNVRCVLVDQGSGAEIMYPDLYRGLELKLGDLTSYDSPPVGFDGKVVIPIGQVKLPVQAESELVDVNFIVVDAYSPYTAIVARPWLHAMGLFPPPCI
ncbi:uncharacterized protein LOC142644158 [Castanea sativa]|uniref:uncharacterized protein LOC142644158 n=1 Tax=Castanea sativa TaxID=21020 RepID=UPI003F649874